MQRDLNTLTGKKFDVAIIGGGIYGVCCAWDAALRGLSVALIEKGDFGSATSSNSLKIIHGGLRYLQHGDFKRMRESIAERKTLMHIAPHLVYPLPCIMPTYGHALKGKEAMSLALLINDVVGFDRNGLADPEKYMPRGKVVSVEECEKIIPDVDHEGLTGGAVWYDCQVRNSERLLLSILHSAQRAGAVVANYVSMVDFIKDGNRVVGVRASDNLSGAALEVKADLVINNSGPWLNDVLSHLNGHTPKREYKMSAAMNLVVKRKLFGTYAVGLASKDEFKDSDALVDKGSRLFFVTPWREGSLIGTTHVHYEGAAEDFRIRESDIQKFIDDVNQAYPAAKLTRDDISFFYGGLLPDDTPDGHSGDVRLLKSYKIIDHKTEDGLDGLLSVVSVKYTTARDVAAKTVDCALKKLRRKRVASTTAATPVFGGQISNFQEYVVREKARAYQELDGDAVEHLVSNYGSEYPGVANLLAENPDWRNPVDGQTTVLRAEVVYAVRREMAMKLADVVRRRTELGSTGNPGLKVLRDCAHLVAVELGWDKAKIEQEIAETESIYEAAQ